MLSNDEIKNEIRTLSVCITAQINASKTDRTKLQRHEIEKMEKDSDRRALECVGAGLRLLENVLQNLNDLADEARANMLHT